MVTETISTNPASSVVPKATESVRRPPASPEVTLIQPTQSISASGESEQAVNESQNIETAVTKAISQIQIMMDLRNRSVSFTRDQETGTDVIKVIDDNTGDIIRQMPSEELLTFMKNLTRMLGTFIDEKA
jgi:flagellar protein FlaG|tara:strand:- start:102 stop:491 length:390 start_codon:yes stop_codon:yes gene_type:complete